MTAPTQPPSQRVTYAEALAAVAALQAAAGGDASTVGVISALAEQVIALRERITDWALGLISALWAPVNPYDGDQVQQFTIDAAARMAQAQTVVARASGAAQAQALQRVGVSAPAAPSDPIDVRRMKLGATGLVERPTKQTVDYSDSRQIVDLDEDATTQGIFNRPARTYRYLQSQGVDVAQAQQAALDRLGSLVEDNLMLAQRLAEAEVLAGAAAQDTAIIGLRRIIHPELSRTGVCGLCIAAADRMYFVTELRPIHDRCKCTTAAVLEGFDPADTLNKADLRQVYADAAATNAAALKRTRYQIDEHGELGPVLIPAKRHKPRKKFTPGRRGETTPIASRAAR